MLCFCGGIICRKWRYYGRWCAVNIMHAHTIPCLTITACMSLLLPLYLVYCRKRPSKFGHLKHASTSANVYWQFEKESDGRSGEPLSWGERCRIKHLPTRRYLAVLYNDGQYKVDYRIITYMAIKLIGVHGLL